MGITASDLEQRRWPFAKLEVTDPPCAITKPGDDQETRVKAQRQAHTYGMKMGKKFKTRTIDGIVYVMRIK